MKRKITFFLTFILFLLNAYLWLNPSYASADDYCNSLTVTPLLNNTQASWVDTQFNQIQYTVHFSDGEIGQRYLIYSDSNVQLNGDISEEFTVTADDIANGHTNKSIKSQQFLNVNGPFSTSPSSTHTITVARSPHGPSEYHCATFSYTILSAPTPTPAYSCRITTNPTTNLSDHSTFDVKISVNQPITLPQLFLNSKNISSTIKGSGKEFYTTMNNPARGKATFLFDMYSGSYQAPRKEGSCSLSINICTPEELSTNPNQCGLPTPTPTPAVCPFARCNPPNCGGECSYCPWNCPNYASPTPPRAPAADIESLCKSAAQTSPEMLSKCLDCAKGKSGIWTAVGCLPTSLDSFVSNYLFTVGIGIIGGVAFLYLLYGSFLILTSAGNPEQVAQAREIITSSIMGLLLAIFSVLILRIISVDILKLPGFN